jgi:aspartyl/asparaginyl beta-hydroxylase (cupin superfamily)
MLPSQVDELTQQGIEALRRNDPQAALAALQPLVATGHAQAAAHLGLGYAHAMLNDDTAAQRAVDAVLAQEPRNLRALLLKADLFHRGGDGAAAASFYQAVLKAVPEGSPLKGEMLREVDRARAMASHYQQALERQIRGALADAHNQPRPVSARFAQSVGILLGERQVYHQQPKHYYFPELPQVQFYERDQFAWLASLEAATADIRSEALAVLQGAADFKPYVQRDPTRPSLSNGGMLDDPNWGAFYLWKNGAVVPENAARCPRTMAALAHLPLPAVPGRSPSMLFSLMRPGAHIPAHNGFVNTRLICHLPLIVPAGCRFRVGHETREWVEGQAWVFDDTIEHEAWNPTDQPRVILLFEVWQPALTPDERDAVCGLFQAIDQLPGGGGGNWAL